MMGLEAIRLAVCTGLLVCCWAAFGCLSNPRGRVRFANEPIAWRVNDRLDVPQPPKKRGFDHMAYVFHSVGHRPLDDVLAVHAPVRAANVNALDEVPDSTWFTNRIGVRDLSLAEMRVGPNVDGGPDRSGPWTILSQKRGGGALGFLIEDARGDVFLLKFDGQIAPEMETAANVVVQRLLWAIGYNVPQDSVEYFDRDRLVVAPDARTETAVGKEIPLTDADVDVQLEQVRRDDAGQLRGLTSRFLSGEPLGGFPQVGTRPDDPNDRVPHEHLRELRGLYVFAAWLAHSDMKEDNTVDTWIVDPRDPSRHYVQHHLVDFGKALGVMAWADLSRHDGWAHNFDYAYALGSALALGLWKRPWEDRKRPPIRGVGVFDSRDFAPGRFRSRNRFVPFKRKDRFDAFWAAKIVMRFSPGLIRTAVERGAYVDPAAVDYLTRTLVSRQRKTGRYWFSQVNPLDDFTVSDAGRGNRVCARDLLLAYGLDDRAAQSTRYALRAYDYDGHRLAWSRTVEARPDGRLCASGLPAAPGAEGYTIVGLFTQRGDDQLAPIWLHLARDPATSGLRVIGVDRQ